MIPTKEFVKLEKEAREAYKKQDFAKIAQINQRLADINTNIYWINDKAYLTTFNPEEIIYPDGETQ